MNANRFAVVDIPEKQVGGKYAAIIEQLAQLAPGKAIRLELNDFGKLSSLRTQLSKLTKEKGFSLATHESGDGALIVWNKSNARTNGV